MRFVPAPPKTLVALMALPWHISFLGIRRITEPWGSYRRRKRVRMGENGPGPARVLCLAGRRGMRDGLDDLSSRHQPHAYALEFATALFVEA